MEQLPRRARPRVCSSTYLDGHIRGAAQAETIPLEHRDSARVAALLRWFVGQARIEPQLLQVAQPGNPTPLIVAQGAL